MTWDATLATMAAAMALAAQTSVAQTTVAQTPAGVPQAAVPEGGPASWFAPADYPPEALRRHEEGRVVATLAVDAAGRVVTCSIFQTSGSSALDDGTCRIALGSIRFRPARDRTGQAIASTYRLPVRWQIPTEALSFAPVDVTRSPPDDTLLEITLLVAPGGKLSACHVEHHPEVAGSGAQEACGHYAVGDQVAPPWLRGGKVVGGRIVTRVTHEVLIDR